MDSLMPAPKHNYCNGICEGCTLYPEYCPGDSEEYEGDTPLGDCLDCEHLKESYIEVDHYQKWDGYYCNKADIDWKAMTCANFESKG